MYPATIFNWYDQSAIVENEAAATENAPLFLAAASFDKGPEDMRVVFGQQFYRLFGSQIDFAKHGQPAIQIKNIIDNGGKVLIKRVVANNATLANVILVATVNTVINAIPYTDEAENPNAKTIAEITGGDTSEDTDETPRYTTEYNSTVKWTAVSVAGAHTTADVLEQIESLERVTPLTPGTPSESGNIEITASADYPIIVITDNGRGVSNKAVKFSPDYNSSKNMGNFFYAAHIFEGTVSQGTPVIASLNPGCVINSTSYTFDDQTSDQVVFTIIDGNYEKYVNDVSVSSGIDASVLNGYDIINLVDNRNVAFPGISIADDSIDLEATYGIALTNGTNGDFGDAPFGTAAYESQLVNFFSGNFDDSIFDLDQYKICAVVDANYPVAVKEAIASLVNFREDCYYFRDFGTNVKTYGSIVEARASLHTFGRFIADYLTNYEIYDPMTGKRIRVTMMYDLAAVLVNHFANGAYRPIAGVANNIILTSAIKGTVNFVPRITPHVNQKSLLEDLKVNYAIFEEDQCVVQSLYTSQEQYTQLSYINNVLAIEEVARAVRTSCPKNRYTFASGSDFTAYSTEVASVLANYANNFAELKFEYTQSAIHAAQKIFYATIKFRFNNWAQTEVFDLYALPTELNSEG